METKQSKYRNAVTEEELRLFLVEINNHPRQRLIIKDGRKIFLADPLEDVCQGKRILIVADDVPARVLLKMGAAEVVCCNSTQRVSEKVDGISYWQLKEFLRKSVECEQFDTVLLWQGAFDSTDHRFYESIKACIKPSVCLVIKLDWKHNAEMQTIYKAFAEIFSYNALKLHYLKFQGLRLSLQLADSNPHESSTGRVSQATQTEQQNAFTERVSKSTQTEEQDVQQQR